MTKLSELMPEMATILNFEEKSVKVIAMHLRKNGLISSGGRGRGGADMTAQDLTNLLLGIMAGGNAVDTPKSVKKYRNLPCDLDLSSEYRDEKTWGFKKNTDYYFGLDPQKFHTLGALLDGMFYYSSNHGDLGGDGLNEKYIRADIFISHPTPKAAIHIYSAGNSFEIHTYFQEPPLTLKNILMKRNKNESYFMAEGCLEYTIKATIQTIDELGEILRGKINMKLNK